MKCEYCDSYLSAVPENGVCPNCGGLLPERKPLQFPEPPVGVYKDVGGYLQIEKEQVVFYRHRWPFTSRTVQMISFDEIYDVLYILPKALRCGAVCVRQWIDRNKPMPLDDFTMDPTSVYFPQDDAVRFYPLYVFLKTCAERNMERRKEE